MHETVAKWHARSGTAIVMDPWTGEILALANVAGLRPDPTSAITRPTTRRDRAVTDAYEPGSTFKLITAAAALESGKVTLDARASRRATSSQSAAHDSQRRRRLHGRRAAAARRSSKSSSTRTTSARPRSGCAIGAQTIYDMIAAFGFGEPTDVDLPGENPGIVPPARDWSDTSLADDLVRPRHLGDAARDGARLLRDRQRRALAAAAHRRARSTTSTASWSTATGPKSSTA